MAIAVAVVDVLYVWFVGFFQGATSDMPWVVPSQRLDLRFRST